MKKVLIYALISCLSVSCQNNPKEEEKKEDTTEVKESKLERVIFDTDANNELDDQHALAYLLFNGKTFDIEGVTVNTTRGGGEIEQHYQEAERIIKLCNLAGQIILLKGANKSFKDIESKTDSTKFDGSDAVNFMIEQARAKNDTKLTLLAVGKLTNVALALKKAPDIADKVNVVWLGSNYPEPGEYNQDNDTIAMNYVLNTRVPFEMVTVRFGKPSGTAFVQVTQTEINQKMPGLGPKIKEKVKGRHEGEFDNFGDYSINLFKHIDYHGNPPARALFDMVAVAILKNPAWGMKKEIPCPILINNQWKERPNNPRKITVWENFEKEKILQDFFSVLKNYELVKEKK